MFPQPGQSPMSFHQKLTDFFFSAVDAPNEATAIDIIDLCTKNGVDKNARDADGTNILNNAVLKNRVTIFHHLVKIGVALDANHRYPSGRTPLMVALELRSKDIVKVLLSAGADVNSHSDLGSVLHHAVFSSPECLELVLAASPNLNQQDVQGRTTLMTVGPRADIKNLEMFIKAGADVNSRDKKGQTALTYFIKEYCNAQKVKCLLDAGADPNIADSEGQTPYNLAWRINQYNAWVNYRAVVKLLDEATKKAKPNKKVFPDGTIFEGLMINGKPVDGLLIFADGTRVPVAYDEDSRFVVKV